MSYQVTKGAKGKVDVKVDVPKDEFDQTYDQVLAALGRDAKIAGFRPGKAPKDVLVGHVGANKILNEAASFLINKHLGEVFEKEKFFPIDSPKISISTLAPGSAFSFTASFTQKPQIKIGDWRKIKIEKVKPKAIANTDVDESIKNIFEAWSKQQKTKNEKQETEEKKEESGKFIYDARGEKIFLKDEPKKSEKSGSPSTKAQDKIDDNFAKVIGARDLAHLKELVRKDLETIVTDQVEAKVEQELFEKLVEMTEVEVPEILVDDELNRILVRLSSQLEQQGRDLDSYLKEEKTTIDELKNKWREQAEKNVKTTLVMDKIGRDEKITVSQEEIETALKGVGEANLTDEQKTDMERYVTLSIFQAKTLDLVKKAVAS